MMGFRLLFVISIMIYDMSIKAVENKREIIKQKITRPLYLYR